MLSILYTTWEKNGFSKPQLGEDKDFREEYTIHPWGQVNNHTAEHFEKGLETFSRGELNEPFLIKKHFL